MIELAIRKRESEKVIQSTCTTGESALAPSEKDNEMNFTSAVCKNDIKSILNDTDVEDVGVKKASTTNKLVTERTRAYNTGDLVAARSIYDQMAFRAAKRRSRRHSAKAFKRALKE